jgi:hypothetical protein
VPVGCNGRDWRGRASPEESYLMMETLRRTKALAA